MIPPQLGHQHNIALRVAQLKRMYLRIIAFGRDAFAEDWSELFLPDFGALNRGPVEAMNVLNSFSLVLLWLARRAGGSNGLNIEMECILATFTQESRREIDKRIDSVLPYVDSPPKLTAVIKSEMVAEALSSSDRTPDIATKTPVDPDLSQAQASSVPRDDSDYKALQILFDAVSDEAEHLRDQLVSI